MNQNIQLNFPNFIEVVSLKMVSIIFLPQCNKNYEEKQL